MNNTVGIKIVGGPFNGRTKIVELNQADCLPQRSEAAPVKHQSPGTLPPNTPTRCWQDGGSQMLRSRGPAARPKLSEALFAVLEKELARGPVTHGWPDQTWTLARIKTLIGRHFHKSLAPSSVMEILHSHGFSHQGPARRALERDEEKVTGWVKDTWPQMEASRRRSGPSSSLRTRPDCR
ncbi:winged helix-turn-helix domain-containing protein [Streptomyces sp. YS-3]|uniref:helix-turn-helix domain-containing protein n=1 Tax=Streptomyces sp. YS-3 TaxID=3381352 RepID=UPI003862A409